MLVRPEWYDPAWEPPGRRQRKPGKLLTALFWACIVVSVLTQLLLF